MPIDYMLTTGCAPQQQLGPQRLIGLSRSRSIAQLALAATRDRGDPRHPSEIGIDYTLNQPGGTREKAMVLQDLIDDGAPLDGLAHHCAGCPVGGGAAFGCHRRIAYPIPEHVEEWLASRLPKGLDSTAGALLDAALRDLDWDGDPIYRLRNARSSFFESIAPYGVRLTGDGQTVHITTDQIFQLMFLTGELSPVHALVLLVVVGVLPHDVDPRDLQDPAGRERVLSVASVPFQEDPGIEELAAFLRMLIVAARLDAPLIVDG